MTATLDDTRRAETPATTRRRAGAVDRQEERAGWLLAAPNLVLLGLFAIVPLIVAVWVSLHDTDGFGTGSFVGLQNYADLFGDASFWRSTVNTALFTALVTPLSMALGLGAAVLLNSALPARPVFRSVLVLPMAVSGVATALLGALIFDQNTGLIDELLTTIGLPRIDWQSSGTPAFASVTLVTLWWRVGFNMLIYLAALQGLSAQIVEAATLDGAGVWQRFRYVTVPMLGPASFFLVVMNVIYSFQVFDIVFVLTGGGPQDATSVLVTYAYENAFVTRQQGYAAAIGMVLLLFTAIFTLVRWRFSRNRDVTE